MREEDGSTVLYATRSNARSSQQHRNTLKALASNKSIKLKTEGSFMRLLRTDEYEEIARDARPAVGQAEAPSLREATPPMCCKLEMITVAQLPGDFDARAREMLETLVAAELR